MDIQYTFIDLINEVFNLVKKLWLRKKYGNKL